jgi:hypothetical protein
MNATGGWREAGTGIDCSARDVVVSRVGPFKEPDSGSAARSSAAQNEMADPHAVRQLLAPLRGWAAATFTLDTRSLAVFRVGLGCLLIADCLLRTRDFRLMFTPDGVFPLETLARYHDDPTLWSLAFLHDASWWGGCVLALEGLAGAALAIGYRTRVATILGWVAVVSVIRRTSPAINAGDIWLACQLFWAMFLPLGSRWSLDAARAEAAEPGRPTPASVCSIASAALVLQLMMVYLGAGLSKCNAGWLFGDALARVLSVHDHGTPLGMLVGGIPWLTRLLQRAALGGEIALPLVLVALPGHRVRSAIVGLFLAFHAAIWLLMTVGLFAAIGMVAWLPLIPAALWPAATAAHPVAVATLGRAATWACGLAGIVAAVSFLHGVTPWQGRPLPQPLVAAINLTCLPQQWAMFGGVPPQEQWVYGRGLLADGSLVDLLRDGRPLETERPAGGFGSLPHHRWHKFFWILPQRRVNVFAAPAAAALARDWNARHGPGRQVVSLEIRFGLQGLEGTDGTLSDALIASWPPRSAVGTGNLERFLRAAAPAADGLPGER